MKCPQCRAAMRSEVKAYRYECGLPRVTLHGIEVRSCPSCGETAAVIPHIEELHHLMALAIIHKRGRLAPEEIRFLRKYLGLSGVDLARRIGVTGETVSRWERTSEPQPMGPVADRALRLMVVITRPAQSYPIEELDAIRDEVEPSVTVSLTKSRAGWVGQPHRLSSAR